MTPFLHAVLWLFIGLFIGASLGVVIAGLCAAAGREPERGWIPVSKPPKDRQKVLVITDEDCFYLDEACDYFGQIIFVHQDEFEGKVTHWMPLPPPPEEE